MQQNVIEKKCKLILLLFDCCYDLSAHFYHTFEQPGLVEVVPAHGRGVETG